MEKKVVATNRKAHHNYEILETCEAGLVLNGCEVKSLRQNQANLTDGLVHFRQGEAFMENVHIAPYQMQSTHVQDYEPRRRRKLLMHADEIRRLYAKTREKGFTLVPLEVYFSKEGRAKVLLGLGKGKRMVDKRASIRKKDMDRDVQRELRQRIKQ